ncbi:hypothetical protein ACOSQ3_008718 [Xanthoceras sorbifolium]
MRRTLSKRCIYDTPICLSRSSSSMKVLDKAFSYLEINQSALMRDLDLIGLITWKSGSLYSLKPQPVWHQNVFIRTPPPDSGIALRRTSKHHPSLV